MKLVFIRHAAAVDRTPEISEASRYLTPEGRIFFRKTAHTILKNNVDPAVILTSPLIRAVQTAEILAETLSCCSPLILRNELQPGFGMQALTRLLDEYNSAAELVLVGHEPDLSTIIAFLLQLSGWFSLKKGAAVKLKINPDSLPLSTEFKWLAQGNKLIASRQEAFSLG
jgi:phosphohistidine phosphatase